MRGCSAQVLTQEGQPEPDGTDVSFAASGGSFDPATAAITNGAASSQLTSPVLDADADGKITVTCDGAEAEADFQWANTKVLLEADDPGTVGGTYAYHFTLTYGKCLSLEDVDALLYDNGWNGAGSVRGIDYTENADGTVTVHLELTIPTQGYKNGKLPLWLGPRFHSPGGKHRGPPSGYVPPTPPPDPPGSYHGSPGDGGAPPIGVEVGNLVIANVEPLDYVCFDPEGPSSVRLIDMRFDIKDIGDPHQYRWVVEFRDTADPGTVVATHSGDTSAPSPIAFTWDGTHPNGDSLPMGTYTFDVHVTEVADATTQTPPSWTRPGSNVPTSSALAIIASTANEATTAE